MQCRFLILAITFALAACDSGAATDVTPAVRLPRSTETLSAIRTSVQVARTIVSPGDSVDIVLTATNGGAQRVQIGMQCGPNLDALVSYPDGAEHSAVSDFITSRGAFVCPLSDYNFANPGETRTDHIPWWAPAEAGEYHVQAALRRIDGLGNLSAAVVIVVRDR